MHNMRVAQSLSNSAADGGNCPGKFPDKFISGTYWMTVKHEPNAARFLLLERSSCNGQPNRLLRFPSTEL